MSSSHNSCHGDGHFTTDEGVQRNRNRRQSGKAYARVSWLGKFVDEDSALREKLYGRFRCIMGSPFPQVATTIQNYGLNFPNKNASARDAYPVSTLRPSDIHVRRYQHRTSSFPRLRHPKSKMIIEMSLTRNNTTT